MKATNFFFIKRLKDGLFYHSTEDGVDTFVSSITMAKHMTKEEAKEFRNRNKGRFRHKMEILVGTQIE